MPFFVLKEPFIYYKYFLVEGEYEEDVYDAREEGDVFEKEPLTQHMSADDAGLEPSVQGPWNTEEEAKQGYRVDRD